MFILDDRSLLATGETGTHPSQMRYFVSYVRDEALFGALLRASMRSYMQQRSGRYPQPNTPVLSS